MHSLSKLRLTIDNTSAAARYPQPAHREFMRLGCEFIRAYHADLAIDAVTLHDAKPGEAFIFLARESGSHLYYLKGGPSQEEREVADTIAEHGEYGVLAAAIIRIVEKNPYDLFPTSTFHRVTWEVL